MLFASILAGGVVCTAEFLFILLSCGPFWLDLGVFFETWLIYSSVTLLGLVPPYVLSLAIPPLKRLIQNTSKSFFLAFLLSWIIGAALLISLVIKDLDVGASYWPIIIFSLLLGLGLTLVVKLFQRRRVSIAVTTGLLSLLLALLAGGVYFVSANHYSAEVHRRTAAYAGRIPNLCLIVLDTARGDHFSCYGYPFPTTPNVDAIAQEGLLCRKAFSASNRTPPGHISIFTGTYPSQHGNDGQPYMPDDLLSIAEILSQEGYYCVALYNNPLAGRNVNITQGFDVDVGVYRHSWIYPAWARLRDKLIYKDSGSKITFLIALKTALWMQQRGGHLFLHLNLVEPHADYVLHEPYFTEFTQTVKLTDIPNLEEVKALCAYVDKVIYDSTKFAHYNTASYRYLQSAYDSEIAYMDHHFGVFSRGMKAAGLMDSTLLVITADHGEFLGEHFTRGHPDILFNPVMQIPLIMRYPAWISPSVNPEYSSNVDIFPTVLNLMGFPDMIPESVQGVNLLSGETRGDRLLLSERINGQEGCYSLITRDYKLILNTDPLLLQKFPFDTLLMDIQSDPGEMMDLHSLQQDRSQNMAADLQDWITGIQVRASTDIELSEDAVANLKALGYVH